MKILIISQYFWPENFRINELSNQLKILGNEVTVLTGLPNYPEGKIYEEFKLTSITKPCVIVFSERKTDIGIGGSEVFIYESPDNGKTVYKRKFGSYECKVLINIGDLN